MSEQKESVVYKWAPYVYFGSVIVCSTVGSVLGAVEYHKSSCHQNSTFDMVESSIVGGAGGMLIGAFMGLLSPITVPGLIAISIYKNYK